MSEDERAGFMREISTLDTCVICLETPQDPTVTPCNHYFCWRCIHRYVNLFRKSTVRCPLCKTVMSRRSITKISLIGDIAKEAGAVEKSCEENTSGQLGGVSSSIHSITPERNMPSRVLRRSTRCKKQTTTDKPMQVYTDSETGNQSKSVTPEKGNVNSNGFNMKKKTKKKAKSASNGSVNTCKETYECNEISSKQVINDKNTSQSVEHIESDDDMLSVSQILAAPFPVRAQNIVHSTPVRKLLGTELTKKQSKLKVDTWLSDRDSVSFQIGAADSQAASTQMGNRIFVSKNPSPTVIKETSCESDSTLEDPFAFIPSQTHKAKTKAKKIIKTKKSKLAKFARDIGSVSEPVTAMTSTQESTSLPLVKTTDLFDDLVASIPTSKADFKSDKQDIDSGSDDDFIFKTPKQVIKKIRLTRNIKEEKIKKKSPISQISFRCTRSNPKPVPLIDDDTPIEEIQRLFAEIDDHKLLVVNVNSTNNSSSSSVTDADLSLQLLKSPKQVKLVKQDKSLMKKCVKHHDDKVEKLVTVKVIQSQLLSNNEKELSVPVNESNQNMTFSTNTFGTQKSLNETQETITENTLKKGSNVSCVPRHTEIAVQHEEITSHEAMTQEDITSQDAPQLVIISKQQTITPQQLEEWEALLQLEKMVTQQEEITLQSVENKSQHEKVIPKEGSSVSCEKENVMPIIVNEITRSTKFSVIAEKKISIAVEQSDDSTLQEQSQGLFKQVMSPSKMSVINICPKIPNGTIDTAEENSTMFQIVFNEHFIKKFQEFQRRKPMVDACTQTSPMCSANNEELTGKRMANVHRKSQITVDTQTSPLRTAHKLIQCSPKHSAQITMQCLCVGEASSMPSDTDLEHSCVEEGNLLSIEHGNSPQKECINSQHTECGNSLQTEHDITAQTECRMPSQRENQMSSQTKPDISSQSMPGNSSQVVEIAAQQLSVSLLANLDNSFNASNDSVVSAKKRLFVQKVSSLQAVMDEDIIVISDSEDSQHAAVRSRLNEKSISQSKAITSNQSNIPSKRKYTRENATIDPIQSPVQPKPKIPKYENKVMSGINLTCDSQVDYELDDDSQMNQILANVEADLNKRKADLSKSCETAVSDMEVLPADPILITSGSSENDTEDSDDGDVVLSTQDRNLLQTEVQTLEQQIAQTKELLNQHRSVVFNSHGTANLSTTVDDSIIENTPGKPSRVQKLSVASPEKMKEHNESTAPITKPLLIIGTGLSGAEIEQLNHFCQLFNIQQGTQLNFDVTHIVVHTDETRMARHTLKFVQGVVNRKWIVVSDWITQSIAANEILPVCQFEALNCTGAPGPQRAREAESLLMKGFAAYIQEPLQGISTHDMKSLLEACGATVIPTVDKFDKSCDKNIYCWHEVEDSQQVIDHAAEYNSTVINMFMILECMASYDISKITQIMVHNQKILSWNGGAEIDM